MSENPVPETLETIAAKIDALSKAHDKRFTRIDERFNSIDERFSSIDQQFARVDQQFAKVDQQFSETRAQLGVKIEAVETKVTQVYDEVIAMREATKRNAADHKIFTKRLDNHDLRILALENPAPPKL